MDIKEFGKILFYKAAEYGFTEYELYYNSGESFKVAIFEGDIDEYKNTSYQGAGFRGIYKGKMGYAHSEKMDADVVDYLLKNAAENAVIMENNDEKLYKGDTNYPKVTGVSQKLLDTTVEEKIKFAKIMEKTAYEADKRVSSVEHSVVATSVGDTYIANSYGNELYQKSGYATAYVEVDVKDADEIKANYEVWQGIDFDGFDPFAVSKKAVEKTVKSLGAGPIKSGKYDAILKNEVAIDFINVFMSSFAAETVQKGFSLLVGKIGEKIASDVVNIQDVAVHKDSITPLSFDSEGVVIQDKSIVTEGVLNAYFYNYKSALKDNTTPMGNGFKGSYKGTVGTACANCFIEPGEQSLEQLQTKMGSGLVITSLQGLHSGCNGISGDFSLIAEGFLIENGKEVKPVEQITVAGNFYDLLKNITAIGSDLKFEPQGAGGSLGCPSILVNNLSVSGL